MTCAFLFSFLSSYHLPFFLHYEYCGPLTQPILCISKDYVLLGIYPWLLHVNRQLLVIGSSLIHSNPLVSYSHAMGNRHRENLINFWWLQKCS